MPHIPNHPYVVAVLQHGEPRLHVGINLRDLVKRLQEQGILKDLTPFVYAQMERGDMWTAVLEDGVITKKKPRRGQVRKTAW